MFRPLLAAALLALAPALVVPVALAQSATAQAVEVQTLTRRFANSYLVRQGDRAILVDTGHPQDAAWLEDAIRRAGVDPARLGAVVITHGHHDHAGAARHFQERHGVPVIAGQGDLPLLTTGRNDPLCPTGSFARARLARDQAGRYPPVTPDIAVRQRLDLTRLTGVPVTLVVLAGHTPGSLVALAGDGVIVGDLFRGTVPPGRAARHFYMCDPEDNTADILRLLEDIAPQASRFYPGHLAPMTRDGVRRLIARLRNEG